MTNPTQLANALMDSEISGALSVTLAGEKPFIVVDGGRFRGYVLDKLKEVEATMIGAET